MSRRLLFRDAGKLFLVNSEIKKIQEISRRDDLASLGVRALMAATLATLMTGSVAGIFSGGEGVLLFRQAKLRRNC